MYNMYMYMYMCVVEKLYKQSARGGGGAIAESHMWDGTLYYAKVVWCVLRRV